MGEGEVMLPVGACSNYVQHTHTHRISHLSVDYREPGRLRHNANYMHAIHTSFKYQLIALSLLDD